MSGLSGVRAHSPGSIQGGLCERFFGPRVCGPRFRERDILGYTAAERIRLRGSWERSGRRDPSMVGPIRRRRCRNVPPREAGGSHAQFVRLPFQLFRILQRQTQGCACLDTHGNSRRCDRAKSGKGLGQVFHLSKSLQNDRPLLHDWACQQTALHRPWCSRETSKDRELLHTRSGRRIKSLGEIRIQGGNS